MQFLFENCLELTPKMTKILYAIFFNLSTDFADLKNEKDQQGKNLLSSRPCQDINAVFNKQLTPKLTKTKVSHFSPPLFNLCRIFDSFRGLEILELLKKKDFCDQ